MKLKSSPFRRHVSALPHDHSVPAPTAHVMELAPTVDCKEQPADWGGFVGTEKCVCSETALAWGSLARTILLHLQPRFALPSHSLAQSVAGRKFNRAELELGWDGTARGGRGRATGGQVMSSTNTIPAKAPRAGTERVPAAFAALELCAKGTTYAAARSASGRTPSWPPCARAVDVVVMVDGAACRPRSVGSPTQFISVDVPGQRLRPHPWSFFPIVAILPDRTLANSPPEIR